MPRLFDFTTEKAIFTDEQAWFNFSSLVHMSAGYFMGRWGLTFLQTAVIHELFELWESTSYGVAFFDMQCFRDLRSLTNKYLGKDLWSSYKGDSWQNSLGDNISAWVGWWLARG